MIQQMLPAQFMCWVLVHRPGEPAPDKMPCLPDGRVVDAHTPAHWCDYDTAAAAVAAGRAAGVAFVLTENDPWFFLDLDKCLDRATGQWRQEAITIWQSFPGAWGEVSQSGSGLHIMGKCRPEALADRKNKWDGWLEFYTKGRFIAFGKGWAPTDGVGYRDVDWTDQLLRIVPERPAMTELLHEVDPAYTGPEDDDELIAMMLKSTGGAAAAFGGGATVKDLWEANRDVLVRVYPDFHGRDGQFDHSSADAALMSHLAFWTGKNMARMDRLFRRSALMRDKYEKREDYRTETVRGAAMMCRNVYNYVKPADRTPGIAGVIERNPTVFLRIPQMVEKFAGCVYIRDQHRVLTADGDLLKPEQFKTYFGGHLFQMNPDGSGSEKNAFVAFTENRTHNFPKVARTAFDPNRPPGEIRDDTVNIYHREDVTMTPGDITPFFDLLHKILPHQTDRDTLLAWMASAVQNPGVKFQWAPVLQGTEGNGKTFFANCVAEAIGNSHTHRPKASQLTEKFNGYLERCLLAIVEEIRMGDRREVLDDLKDKVTNEMLEIRGMHAEKRMVKNFTKWFFCSNYRDAVIKSKNDRRYAVFFTAQQSYADLARDGMTGSYFPNLYRWARGGGYAAVAHYLANYAIPAELDPAGLCHRAPNTSSTAAAIQQTVGRIEAAVIEASEDGTPGFRNGFISSIALEKLLRENRFTLAVNKRGEMLEAIGYRKIGRTSNPVIFEGDGNKRATIYAHDTVQVQEGVAVDGQYLASQGYVGAGREVAA